VRDGYYYLGGGETNNITLESTPARIHEKNNALLETPDTTNGIVNITSVNEGKLGNIDFTNHDSLELETPVLMKDRSNNIIYSTSTVAENSLIEFTSKLTGYLGSTFLKEVFQERVVSEHLSIRPTHILNNIYSYDIIIQARDIQKILIRNLTSKKEKTIEYPYDAHINTYTHSIDATTDNYLVQVITWDEYTYTKTFQDINSNLDIITGLVGANRRDYQRNTTQSVIVNYIVDTVNGDDKDDGLNPDTALQSLKEALLRIDYTNNRIGFTGTNTTDALEINRNTIIYGDNRSNLKNTVFLIRPYVKLELHNVWWHNQLITNRVIYNTREEDLII
jgi:hypothetical protein